MDHKLLELVWQVRPAHETRVGVTGMEQLLVCVFPVPTYTPAHESAQRVLSTGLTVSILRREFCSRGFSSVSVLLVRRLLRSQEITKTRHSQHLWNEWRRREDRPGSGESGHASPIPWTAHEQGAGTTRLPATQQDLHCLSRNCHCSWKQQAGNWLAGNLIYIYLYHRTIWSLLVEILWVC